MKPSKAFHTWSSMATAALLATALAKKRYVMYFDQYHTTNLPNKTVTAGITHLITAFAASDLFTTSPAGDYTPFKTMDEFRALVDDGAKICMAIGGWGDTQGFSIGATNETSRQLFAKNVADTVERLGYDCVDIDWEYPGGNGADYKQIPNSDKVSEIETFPLLLAEIKKAIDSKELSIAVPGLERDMLAYTAEKVPLINEAVDFVNVMSYDLLNRRDDSTHHHTNLQGSLAAVDRYIERGIPPHKLTLGFAFYAKWFTTADGAVCNQPIGCPGAVWEDAEGQDTGLSGAFTFELQNLEPTPTDLTESTDGSCGPGTFKSCPAGTCCSSSGFCGTSDAHCGTGCWPDYGECKRVSFAESFRNASANGQMDEANGGQWYWDATKLFWTWDTPSIMEKKFPAIVDARGLGGIMAWSMAEDSYDWSHLLAMQSYFQSQHQDTCRETEGP